AGRVRRRPGTGSGAVPRTGAGALGDDPGPDAGRPRASAGLARRCSHRPPVPPDAGPGHARRLDAVSLDRDGPGDLAGPRLAGARSDRRIRARPALRGGATVRACWSDAGAAVELAR